MKRCLLIIFFIVSIISCKDDHPDLTSGENKIDLLRAEFEKQTGYDQSQVHLLTPTFRSEVDWSKAIYKGEDTVLVTVRLLDTVIYPINNSEVNLKDNVILKGVRNKKLEWSFTTVIFVPTSLTGGYSGLILSRPLSNKAERIRYYNKGSVINSDEVIRIKFANNKGKSQSGSKLRAGCTYAYVNGILNQVTCTPPEKGEREDDPGFGEPGDYFPPGHGGGSGSGVTSFNILASGPKIDPKQENKCFNTNQPAELTIYVQQAKEGSRDLVGPNEVGHVFVGIKQGGIERFYGFYPESGSNSAMVAVGKDYSSELRDNSGEMHHVSITKSITASQLNSIVSYANNPPQTYNVNSYACTDFGIAVGKLGGINLPATKATNMVFNGTSPGNLGEDIRSGNFPNTTKNTNKSNAPSKKGSCP